MKTLQVLETGYRATVEEQDDTIVWLTHAMAGAGGQFGMLLTGNAVCYAVRDQRAPALSLGAWTQSHAADLGADVAALAARGSRSARSRRISRSADCSMRDSSTRSTSCRRRRCRACSTNTRGSGSGERGNAP
jgi:hypothetical protein